MLKMRDEENSSLFEKFSGEGQVVPKKGDGLSFEN